jgi:hypothetical protein
VALSERPTAVRGIDAVDERRCGVAGVPARPSEIMAGHLDRLGPKLTATTRSALNI